LLPLGTANNIAKSLGISGHAKEIISNLDKDKRQKYDVGRIKGLKCAKMFLESFGFGVFPELMKSMKEQADRETGTPEEELKLAVELLHRIILNNTLQRFHISVDGTEQTGKYLLAEVMNIASLGPNLRLNPDADPGDGKFEVVLIPENMRTEFADYVSNMVNGTGKDFTPLIIRGKDIIISTDSKLVHIDDQLKELKKPSTVTITPEQGKLEFLIPNGGEN
jgi:diacylglycerol kinase (ATP)